MRIDPIRIVWLAALLLVVNATSPARLRKPCESGQHSVPTRETSQAEKKLQEYRNKNYNFSFKYPSGWGIYEGFDGNGVSVYPFSKIKSALQPAIGVGGTVGQPSEKDSRHLQTLQEDIEFRMHAMKEGPDPASNLKVVSSEPTIVQGLPAIVITAEFDSGNPKQGWVLKEILIHTRDDAVTYHLSLICRREDFPNLAQSFGKIAETFRILGPPS